MTLIQLGAIFWHDLAAPIMVGVLTAMIVNRWSNRR
jgi:hypothetical protein